MRFIHKLEHSRTFWFLLFTSIVFFLLRLPSVIEPYWYGDEGIYEVIGRALRSGRLLYAQIWDNKPPLLYLIYALFDGNQPSVRLLSLIVGLLTTIAFFFLAKELLKRIRIAMIVTICFAVLFATPIIEGNIANAENFMLLPIICAGLLVYCLTQHNKFSILNSQRSTLFAGLLLGIACMIKIVAIFDFSAFLLFLLIISLPKTYIVKRGINLANFKAITKEILLLFSGFLLPFLIACLFFLFRHALTAFFQAIFIGNISYVGVHNELFFSQGLLVIKILLLIIALVVVYWKRNKLARSELFIVLWFLLATFNAFFSQRPYTHYLLVLLPGFCLLAGICLETRRLYLRLVYILMLTVIFIAIVINFTFFGPLRTVDYYGNVLRFLTNNESVEAYQSFFDPMTPRDYEVAYFIKSLPFKSPDIFIWGDHAEIYALSHTLPPGRFTVAYHIDQDEANLKETDQVLKKNAPPVIITLSEAPSYPFSLAAYPKVLLLKGATVYEKDF